VAWSSTSASARLENRGALLVGNDLAPKSVWMVRVIAPDAAKPAEAPRNRLLPLGAIMRPALRTHAPRVRSPSPSGVGPSSLEGEVDEGQPSGVEPSALEVQVEALRPEGVPVDEIRVQRAGAHLAISGDARFLAQAAELVDKTIGDATHGYSIEAKVGTVPSAGFRPPAANELGALEPLLPHRALTAAIFGDRVVLLGGESHAYLKDRNIEIAEKASVDDPIVDVFFTGFAASCRVAPASERRCSLQLSLEYQELLELSPIATGSKEVAELELPRIAATCDRISTELTLGSWVLVHTAPLDGTDKQLVVLIRVTDA
jgi:hypothetical protein